MRPLSDIIRPTSIEEMVGQQHLLGEGKLLRSIADGKDIPNMIFYGPSGVGKTTLARIISEKSDRKLYKLNATTASINDIKEIINDINPFTAPNGILLYLDEIQYFNKKQQQSLLEFMENGKIIIVIACLGVAIFLLVSFVIFLIWRNVELSRKIIVHKKELDELRQHNSILQESKVASKKSNKKSSRSRTKTEKAKKRRTRSDR
mgnify:CR=1 FL=1